MFHGFPDQTHSHYQSRTKFSKRNIQCPLISEPAQNLLPSKFQSMGLFQSPPPFLLQYSHPPSYSFRPPTQPPLLPLPVASTLPLSRYTPQDVNKRANVNNSSRSYPPLFTPKKSNSPTKNPKTQQRNSPKKVPNDVKKAFSRVSSGNIAESNGLRNNSLSNCVAVKYDKVDLFSDSVVFIISPPPSSLPMPTFSLKPKLNCNAEAAGSDMRATNNLQLR